MKRGAKVTNSIRKVDKVVNIADEITLSDLIKKRAKEKGYSMQVLSKALGYSRSGFLKMMKSNSYKASVIVDLSKFLDISFDTISNIHEGNAINVYGPTPTNDEERKKAMEADQRSVGLGGFYKNNVNSKILSRKEQNELEFIMQSISDHYYEKAMEIKLLTQNVNIYKVELTNSLNVLKRKQVRIEKKVRLEIKKRNKSK